MPRRKTRRARSRSAAWAAPRRSRCRPTPRPRSARCDQKGVAYTVLRLGALVDSAGGVPLAFGQGDQQLLDRAADDDVNEPPLISRNDAARIVCHVAGEGLPSLGGATLDVAWQDRWGTTSAGTDETARAAARQDVMADAAAAVFGMAKQEEAAAAAA